ncbi:NAD(P)-dependent oxidoreductase [Gallaecimonas kandeliae]|uniref:NAD(P)-dependent oxidoreductase n=1 Tax=Gallaecimonas kandeliae TaxID=3029055 RepID=UPI00264A0AFB|nr:NAD(P)-dependent oxidoreductase [Gallaecimonas kandeliae]WKE66921.1 NAD(P)-dependent oxidoreductase [Gallaecimonas kandeliae]
MKVAFLGLGVMGYPMAGHLQQAGFDVCVYNRTGAKAEAWAKQHGGRYAATPAEAAQGAELVMMCVGDDDDVRSVAEQALAGMASGAILVDHTTASAIVARELHQALLARGIGFLDAPVSGGQAGAENGQLTIMVGGDEASYAKAEPVLKTYAKQIKRLGEAGAGQLCKMVNQICIAGVVQGLAEGINFAKQAGLNVADVVEVIAKGAAQSWQMENRALTMDKGQYEFGFAVDWMRKDLAIALDEARRNGSQLPLTALVDQFYAEVQRLGGSRWDTSSLLARLEASKA